VRRSEIKKKGIPWISVSAVGMFKGYPTDIQRIGPMSEVDIYWTSTGLTCVMLPPTPTHWNRTFGEPLYEVESVVE
jgi:hypothetical protein